ncbi:MAG: hypothetical protein IT379_09530 [Deltaproteobacteria bacterium]|nr:hypothetical protein [Deltaproteobacteria bacterium]
MGLAAALLLTTAHAAAQQPAQEARYRQLIDEAVADFSEGRWQEALGNFRAAHEVIPNARTLRGIGMASFELRLYVDARRALEQALADQRRALTPEQRAEVDRLLASTRRFTARFRLRPSPPDAQVTVGGAAPTLESDGSLLLEIGNYEVVASMVGYRTARRQVVVRGGEDEELLMPLELESASGGGGGDIEDVLDPNRGRRRRPGEEGGSPALGIAVTATGGALLVGSLVTGIILVRNLGELEDCREADMPGMPSGEFCMNETALERNRDLTAGLTIGLGVGGLIGVTTGIVLVVTSGSSGDAEDASIRCAPGLGGVSCAGRF